MPPDGPLQLLAASLARARGEEFFLALAGHIGMLLDAELALICEATAPQRARTLAAWTPQGAIPNYEFELDGSPCARVCRGERLQLEIDSASTPGAPSNCSAYFGVPLTTSDGAVLGHLCAWLKQPVTLSPVQQSVCDIIADRVAVELRLVHVKRERALLRAQRRQLRAEIASFHDVHAIVGVSAAHQRVMDEVQRVAGSAAAVLIRGEPGTGKELVARAIHAAGQRARMPFTKFDCAAFSVDGDLEALPQVLGFTRGGTLFLDAVDTLSTALQLRLRDVLEAWDRDQNAARTNDVRLIASTGHDLFEAIRLGDFIESLYGRLHIFSIEIPPLRTRVEDVAPLVQLYAQRFARRAGRRIEGMDPDSLVALTRYAWPGNVRELIGLVERAIHAQHGPVLKITPDIIVGSPAERAALIAAAAGDTTLGTRTLPAGSLELDDTLNTGLHAVQREHILRVLKATRWVIEGNSGAALRLGLKPATLRHRMKKLGITRAQSAPVT